ncbi:MAG: hypothetical protein ACJA2G_003135, partial [Cognaticolwellia sp.]
SPGEIFLQGGNNEKRRRKNLIYCRAARVFLKGESTLY